MASNLLDLQNSSSVILDFPTAFPTITSHDC